MKTWILMLCGVSILCLTPAVRAVDTAPPDLGNDVARLTDAGGDSQGGQSGWRWRLKRQVYRRGGVVKVKVGPFHKGHDHWLRLIDKDGKVVAERHILPEEPRKFKYKFRDVDCGGAPHKVKAFGEGECDQTKSVTGRCRRRK